ncbi:MAG: substrate-binding periplasmic protein, partial [Aggregatilineales bacterium]
LWQNAPLIDEFPAPGTVNAALDAGSISIVERLRNGAALRVAGIPDLPPEASLIDQRINGLNRQLVENMAARWGTSVQYVAGDPMQLIASGQADIAAGIEANWQLTDRLDFSVPYLLHGDRLMVESRDDIASFQDLGGRWIGIMDTDTGAGDRAQAWADSISRTVRLYSTFEQTAADAMLVENNADVVYGNSLKLIQHLEANPNVLTLTERWYSREYFVFAMPANDPEFRLLVDYSIQELVKTAELATLTRPLMPPNSELPDFEVWYGTYPGNLPGF